MPVRKELSYTKEKKNITRIVVPKLKEWLRPYATQPVLAVLERPLVNPLPKFFRTTMSAMRALEATLICLEELGIPQRYIDSREWQKALLPQGVTGDALKQAAVDIARRLFPSLETKDADSVLIAEHARRQGW